MTLFYLFLNSLYRATVIQCKLSSYSIKIQTKTDYKSKENLITNFPKSKVINFKRFIKYYFIKVHT